LKSRLHSECDGQNNCCILQGKTPLTPFSAPSLAGVVNPPLLVLLGLPCSAMMPTPYMGGSSMMPVTSPSPPGMMPVGSVPGMRLPMVSRMPPTACSSHHGAHSASQMTEGRLSRPVLCYLFYFIRWSWCCDSGCFLIAQQGRLVPPSY
uniref:Uncharacterized protein n=1 Tax=Spermophilus dauricus TaxID=99837 RepID=A0A8C9QMU8_SPEDA